MTTKDLNEKELLEYFSEHVRYEVQMLLNATTAILLQLEVPQGLQHMPVESYAVHLRNLITFLYPSVSRDTDVCAKDFFIVEETWEKIRPDLSDTLGVAKTRADREVGHLTIFRQNGTPENKVWDVKNLPRELMPLIVLFSESADRVHLKSTLNDHIKFYTQYVAGSLQ